MHPFGWVEEEGRCAGAGQRGGNLLPDEAGLAHARDDDFPFAGGKEIHSLSESPVETANEGLDGSRLDQ